MAREMKARVGRVLVVVVEEPMVVLVAVAEVEVVDMLVDLVEVQEALLAVASKAVWVKMYQPEVEEMFQALERVLEEVLVERIVTLVVEVKGA